jgi:hypothetical protein
MPFLYVANTLEQDQSVYYRTEFDTPLTPERLRGQPAPFQNIQKGRQEALGKRDFDHEVIMGTLIPQLRAYGAVEPHEIRAGHRGRGKISLVYNVGAPVAAADIRDARAVNNGILILEGQARRATAAVMNNKTVEEASVKAMIEHDFDPADAPMRGFSVETEQLDEFNDKGSRLEEGHGAGRLDPRGAGAPPIAPPVQTAPHSAVRPAKPAARPPGRKK